MYPLQSARNVRLVKEAMEAYEFSEHCGCRAARTMPGTAHYQPKERSKGRTLTMRLSELAGVRVRYGYRQLTILLKREGCTVGKKRVYRLEKAESSVTRRPPCVWAR